jgi:hypothetical protein
LLLFEIVILIKKRGNIVGVPAILLAAVAIFPAVAMFLLLQSYICCWLSCFCWLYCCCCLSFSCWTNTIKHFKILYYRTTTIELVLFLLSDYSV